MKELQDIVEAYNQATKLNKQTALATVVHVEGSSYRRAGARMLMTEDGQLTGAISGGCLEGDALRKARLAMAQHKPMLVMYDTTDDDDAKFGVGLGCNGIIHILIEPLSADDEQNPIFLFTSFLNKRQSAILVTLFSLADKQAVQPGTCLLLKEDGIQGDTRDNVIAGEIINDAQVALANHISVTRTYSGHQELTAFIELLQPRVSLVIFGAGNDAVPMVKLAAVLGWDVTVIDGRANYAVAERFPLAKKVITAKPEPAIAQIMLDERTVVVLMTHNYNYDIAVFKQLLPLGLSYIGALGPRKKLNRMLDELAEEGVQITDEALKSVFGPAGLDIGAETGDEIALSIVAEIQAVLQKTSGTFLRDKEFIHKRDAQQVITSAANGSAIKVCDI